MYGSQARLCALFFQLQGACRFAVLLWGLVCKEMHTNLRNTLDNAAGWLRPPLAAESSVFGDTQVQPWAAALAHFIGALSRAGSGKQ